KGGKCRAERQIHQFSPKGPRCGGATLCVAPPHRTGRGASPRAFPRRAWERENRRASFVLPSLYFCDFPSGTGAVGSSVTPPCQGGSIFRLFHAPHSALSSSTIFGCEVARLSFSPTSFSRS